MIRLHGVALLLAALVVTGAARADDHLLAPMMRLGRSVDVSTFRHRRTVHLYPSSAGVSRYALTPADIAVARADLGDIRIVDPSGRQASYVLELGRHERMAAEVTAVSRRGTETRYAVDLPHAPVTLVAIEIEIRERFVGRRYRLVAELDGARETVSVGTLERQHPHATPLPLRMSGERRVDRLELAIDDGDDAPLAVTGVKITMASGDLYVVAPPGAYTMLLGNDDVAPPRYELESLRHHLATAPAGEVQVGPLEPNPDRRVEVVHPPPPPQKDQAMVLWGAIGLSVLILGALTLRVARTP